MRLLKSFVLVALLAVSLSACNTTSAPSGQTTTAVQMSPESQVQKGADAHTAATTLATVLLKNDKITVAQAKSYSVLLHAASTSLDNAYATLMACRKTTGSTPSASPDPCAFGVQDVIKLALDSIANVRATLDKK